MHKSQLEVSPKVWVDYRRAVFLEDEGILAVADLHLGYAWAHRFNGQMLPVHPTDRLSDRLQELCSFYKPRVIALLGDIVHQAVPVSAVSKEYNELIGDLAARCSVKLILGNHDRELESLGAENNGAEFHRSIRAGNYLLLHGNEAANTAADTLILMGHEHPAISLGDGVKSAKFPCFLVGERVLVLPAFSTWVAGTTVGSHPFMSAIARNARFKMAVAICGAKLLPVKSA